MKTGKRLEQNIKESCEKRLILYERFKDSTASFMGNDKTRFTPSNKCDCFIFENGQLYFIEAKSTKGKSIPFGNFRDKQIKGLKERAMYKGVKAGFLIYFSDYDELYFLDIKDYLIFKRTEDRKSIPKEYLKENALSVKTRLKKVNIDIDINGLFDKL